MKKRSSLEFILGTLVSYGVFTLLSHPRSKVHQKLPERRYKKVQYLPHIKLFNKERIFHFHHWFLFSLLSGPVLALERKYLKSRLFHGLLAGGILQGLSYPDRFRLVYPVEALAEVVE